MALSEINIFIDRQFEDGSAIFGTIVTATELILGSEYLAKQINQIQGEDKTSPALKKTAQAVNNLEKRYKLLTAMFAGKLRVDANRLDPIFAGEFERGQQMNLSEDVSDSLRSINSISELMVQAARRPPQTLTSGAESDFSSGADEVESGGGGGDGSSEPEAVDSMQQSFDQYPQEILTKATSAFFEQVAPIVESSIFDMFRVPVTIAPDGSFTIGSGSGSGGFGSSNGGSGFSGLNTAIAGVVAGVSLSLGGLAGAALAAFSFETIPRVLAAFEEWLF
jgi:hypothetical protein